MKPFQNNRVLSVLCLLVIRAQTTVTAFQSTRPLQATCPRQRRGGDGVGPLGPVWNTDEPSPLSYSERSRAFRRDYYTHESWIRHRSKERFVGTIIKIFDSGVVRALLDELVVVGGVAAVVISYNALLVTGWDDWGSVHHEPLSWPTQFPLMYLPLTGFTLSSSALSLLLVFKTNSSYQRWDEARKAWSYVVNDSRTVARQSSAWIHQADLSDEEKYALIRRVADAVWLFPRSLQRHLLQPAEDEEAYRRDITDKVSDRRLAEELTIARHKPSLALYEMSCAVNAIPLDTIQRTTLDKAVSRLCDAMGSCDRILSSPVPVVYTRFAARFVEIWMLSLPLALYQPFEGTWNHWPLIPVTMVLGFFFLGIEQLAIELEEPFSVLPLSNIVSGVGLSAEEHVQWMEKTMEKKTTAKQTAQKQRQKEARIRQQQQQVAAAAAAAIEGTKPVQPPVVEAVPDSAVVGPSPTPASEISTKTNSKRQSLLKRLSSKIRRR